MITQVVVSEYVQKQLPYFPPQVRVKLWAWIEQVKEVGVEETRKNAGYHDEPLKGQRQGYRSVRLSRGYRAFYHVMSGHQEFIFVEEVSKHGY